ncbi:MAG: hypothetical protein HQM14_11775 [SAR324 cluster bacterium]|nr:hypothetical protein [SAR324 cluster bacterium]
MKTSSKPQNWMSLATIQVSDFFAKECVKFQKDLNRLYREDIPKNWNLSNKNLVSDVMHISQPYAKAVGKSYVKIRERLLFQKNKHP